MLRQNSYDKKSLVKLNANPSMTMNDFGKDSRNILVDNQNINTGIEQIKSQRL